MDPVNRLNFEGGKDFRPSLLVKNDQESEPEGESNKTKDTNGSVLQDIYFDVEIGSDCLEYDLITAGSLLTGHS